jgi:hypothetical protein
MQAFLRALVAFDLQATSGRQPEPSRFSLEI